MPREYTTSWQKPIVFPISRGPNYLWHLLAVAKIGYDSDYAGEYAGTVDSNDLALLQEQAELLKFAEGEGGALSGFFTALPAWLGIEAKAEFEQYFRMLDKCLAEADLTVVREAYPEADWSDRFMSHFLESPELPKDAKKLRSIARDLGRVYVRSFDEYAGMAWPPASAALEVRALELCDRLAERDLIAAWEDSLGLTFAADRYEVVLCYASKNGPDYNSLGYRGNLIYFNKPTDRTCQFLSHEIGTHLLIDTYFKLASEGTFEHRKLYAAYETLAMFYNRNLLGVDKLVYDIPQFNDAWYLERYEQMYRPEASPEEMLRGVLAVSG